MIRFNNDYSRSAHPAILRALADDDQASYGGYGLDPWCEKAANEIKTHLGRADAAIHFLVGGTQTNFTAIAAALRPYQSAVCADTGHIHVHETGAVEHTGHKIITLPSQDGKITAAQIDELGKSYWNSPIREHITQPKLVYISFPTEYGTVYTRQELKDLHIACDRYDMLLFVDGARLGYGLAASDVTLRDLAGSTDMFSIGGTKCGALFGEALVMTNTALATDFRSVMKQNGAMLAKGWLLGLQFFTLFENGLYFDICRRAVDMAMQIKAAFADRGIPFYIDSPTNQQFVVLTNGQAEKLAKKYVFEPDHPMDDGRLCARFCTSWYTDPADVAALIKDIQIL